MHRNILQRFPKYSLYNFEILNWKHGPCICIKPSTWFNKYHYHQICSFQLCCAWSSQHNFRFGFTRTYTTNHARNLNIKSDRNWFEMTGPSIPKGQLFKFQPTFLPSCQKSRFLIQGPGLVCVLGGRLFAERLNHGKSPHGRSVFTG